MFHVFLATSLGGFVLLLQICLDSWYRAQFGLASNSAATRGSVERKKTWRQLEYLKVTHFPASDTLDRGIAWASLALTSEQAEKLKGRIAQIATYLQNPTFEEYYCLRTDGLSYRLVGDTSGAGLGESWAALALLSLTGNKSPSTWTSEQALRSLWVYVHLKGGEVKPPRITGVCPKWTACELSPSNTLQSMTLGKLAKGFTKLVEHSNPCFSYTSDRTASAFSIQDGPFFHVSFYATVNDSEHAGPIYVSLGWLPRDRNWALAGFLSDQSLGITTIF